MSIWSPFAEGQVPLLYAPGQLIYLQGEPATHFYYVARGAVKSFMSSEQGGERTLTVHYTGALMGEAAFFDQCPRVSSAVALVESQVIPVDRGRLTAVLAAHPELGFSMLQYLARTVRLLSTHVDDSSFRRADQRLARHLLTLSPDADGVLHCTHEELGFAVGVSRVTVSRVLARFAAEGLLATGYRTIRLLKPECLQALNP